MDKTDKEASMRTILKRTGASSGEEVFNLASMGNKIASDALEEMANNLSLGLAQICCIINPEILIMGGAVMSQRNYWEPRLNKYLAEKLPHALLRKTRIAFADLGEMAGCTGALCHFCKCIINNNYYVTKYYRGYIDFMFDK